MQIMCEENADVLITVRRLRHKDDVEQKTGALAAEALKAMPRANTSTLSLTDHRVPPAPLLRLNSVVQFEWRFALEASD